MRKSLFAVFTLVGAFTLCASESDTLARAHNLRPLEVLGVKQAPDGATSAEAVTRVSGAEARRLGIDAVKGLSAVAPNFYMPDYANDVLDLCARTRRAYGSARGGSYGRQYPLSK